MSEVKDSAIKLFGKTIALSVLDNDQNQQPLVLATDTTTATNDDCCDPSPDSSLPEDSSVVHEQQRQNQDMVCVEHSRGEIIECEQKDYSVQIREDQNDPPTSSGVSDNPKTPSADRETSSLKSSKNGEQSETSISQEKTLKKPDKILPCPRCNSMDTKFCYYNNYNLNQPRHFCKNCQRYWTAGGTMRNVPVGAGRRKNKASSASHYRQIMISEALRTVQGNGVYNASYGNNGTVLNFGSDSPFCDTMLNLSDKTQNGVQNGFHGSEQRILVSRGGMDNVDEHSNKSSIKALNSSEKGVNCGMQEPMIKNYPGAASQLPYFPGPPWPFPWNSQMPQPALCPPGFPVSFYPETTYWGTIPGHWNMPCLSPTYSSLTQSASNSSPTASTLGKHSRDRNIVSPAISDREPSRGAKDSDRSVLVPKTLRIDDPTEAAKSSIWATLGIKSEKSNTGEGLFKGFQSKSDDKNYIAETSTVLQANPAAFSRSLNFREST